MRFYSSLLAIGGCANKRYGILDCADNRVRHKHHFDVLDGFFLTVIVLAVLLSVKNAYVDFKIFRPPSAARRGISSVPEALDHYVKKLDWFV